MIAIIDYDAGNMKSVEKAFQYLNEDAVITRDRKAILGADRVVLPGVSPVFFVRIRTFTAGKFRFSWS